MAAEPPDLDWTDAGTPRARGVDDVYYSDIDGRAETAHVFHAGNRLPERWRESRRFVIGELGFGVGLNFLATLALWAGSEKPAGARLSYVSFERSPPPATDVRRAMARWPDLAPLAARLTEGEAWPPPPGWSMRPIAADVDLHLAIGDANALLPVWDAAAPSAVDAWFLDGFTPAKNPDLWGAALMSAVAARTAPGGSAASYTAAGWVRRNLAAAGFAVEKTPGFGAKRDMVRARLGA